MSKNCSNYLLKISPDIDGVYDDLFCKEILKEEMDKIPLETMKELLDLHAYQCQSQKYPW